MRTITFLMAVTIGGIVLLGSIGTARPAHAAPYAAIVMDMRNGQVLYQNHADHRQHPASLTKMMTLYLAFEAIKNGRLSLDQKVRISQHAARQPPSKLYMRPGQRVTVRSLIRAAAIKSANDAATALGEAIGGSESAFAAMMTRKAKQLGMRQSTFLNANGLTRSGHLSTARDMAILARRLYFDFPQYYNIFSRKSAYAAGKRIWTTNRLLSTYRGAEGMKTGYTRAAGYNLVSVARRGNERVIAVVMGGKSSRSRNRKVAELLDLGFRKAPTNVRIVRPHSIRSANTRLAMARAPLPRVKPGGYRSGHDRTTGIAALVTAISPAKAAASEGNGGIPIRHFASSRVEIPTPRPFVLRTGATTGATASTDVPMPRPKRGSRVSQLDNSIHEGPAATPGAARKWQVQVGHYRDPGVATASLATIPLGDIPGLNSGNIRVAQAEEPGGGSVYHVNVEGLSRSAAAQACNNASIYGLDCVAVPPTAR